MELKNLIGSTEVADVYQTGHKAVKLFRENVTKTKVLAEAYVHAVVEETGLPVPPIYEVSKIDGRWAITRECIEGRSLYDTMIEDMEHADKYIELLVDLQLSIHQKTVPALPKLKDTLIAGITALDCIDDERKYELLTWLDSMPKHKKLCHGNFDPHDVLIDGDRTYLVDWLNACQGNASADVARTYLLLCLEFGEEIAEKYLELFCIKSGTKKTYVQNWLPIVAAAELGHAEDGEKELLEKWIDVAFYE